MSDREEMPSEAMRDALPYVISECPTPSLPACD
jgi:hypothetical protein